MKSSKRPTMVDVAQSAKVSLKTVSRVVNGVESVDPELVRRVQQAIDDLGYQRNLIAADLRAHSSSKLIGFISTDLANPFYGTVAAAIDEVARIRGYQLITTGSNESPLNERNIALDLCRRQVAGLVIVPTGQDQSYLEPEIRRGLGVVFVDRPGTGIEADCVLVDNYSLGRRMASIVLSHGHRRIGILVGSKSLYTHHERLRGIVDGLRDAGIEPASELFVSDVNEPQGAEGGARRLLSLAEPPTALLCTNNRLSLGCLTAMCFMNRRVELVAFDDAEYSEILPFPITCIAQDPHAIGKAAAERIFARLDGSSEAVQSIVIPTQVLVRGGNWNLGS
ncbi:LacI family DNA-binding transcriptional regulator [Schaalia vaccimaxillae]|uniref:LacI family DNA-binding transcriptional regulator n=1 Tax=Schaalia vaccimaxillae TaxID=183916 RepID=UPI0003B37E54|nr:LacI family DNA-binding transcriptional regulator [Schaalia vaccimaxillae]